jgi:fucose 4-O-acetylase-like acetyltransferase
MRISFWDKWKGVAIIAVVLIHALGSTANFPVGSLNNDFGIIYVNSLTFLLVYLFFWPLFS